MRIDSHCHVSPLWYEPVEALLFQMDCHDVDKAVLVQMLGQFDNRYQMNCVALYPDRFASVIAVDCASEKACVELAQLVEQGATGVRLRPTARSPGADPLAIWRKANELGIAASCVGNMDAFLGPAFSELIADLPDLPFVLEHLGGTSTPDIDEAAVAAREAVFRRLSPFPNVYLKVPGLGELVPRVRELTGSHIAFANNCPRSLEVAYEQFGADRLLWGSDFPPVSAREGYGNALKLAVAAFDDKSRGEVNAIFAGNAHRLFFRGSAS